MWDIQANRGVKMEELRAIDGQFVKPVIACAAQGTAICHRDGYCSDCVFALAKLNPGKPLFFWMRGAK